MSSVPSSPPFCESDPLAALLRGERHRAKNALQLVASLLSLQTRAVADPSTRALFSAAQDRVRVIALFYERLSRTHPGGQIDFSEGLKELVAMVARGQPEPGVLCQVVADPLQIDLDLAFPLGLVTYELLSDALGGCGSGRIDVSLTVQPAPRENVLTILYHGAARSAAPSYQNDPLRAKVVDVLIRQLKARLLLEVGSGTRLAVHFSVPP